MRQLASIILILVLLTGCAGTNLSAETWTGGVDLRPYTEQGFLVTPESYSGQYQSIGTISITHYPEGISAFSKNVNPDMDAGTSNMVKVGRYFFRTTPIESIIDRAVEEAQSMGGDAIISFSTSYEIVTRDGAQRPKLEVTGFAIDRQSSN